MKKRHRKLSGRPQASASALRVQPWLTVRNQSDATDMIISGRIGKDWWDDSGTSSKEFRNALNKIPAGKRINVRINSEGGSIQDGLEIYNALKDRRADVTCYVDGYAVSIASIIALAGNKTISPKSSVWMIHEPWSVTQGNSEDHARSAEMLDKHGDMLASIYADETGHNKSEMRDAMRKESWFTGEEATAFGLADESPDDQPMALAALDPKSFKNVPSALLTRILAGASGSQTSQPTNADDAPASISAPIQGAATDTNHNNNIMDKTKIIAALKKRGVTVPDNVTDEQLLALLEQNPVTNTTAPTTTQSATTTGTTQADNIIRLEVALAGEKRSRIKAAVLAKGENKIPNAHIEKWVNRAVADEEGTLKEIEEMPVAYAGGQPITGHVIELSAENPVAEIKRKHKTASARYAVMKQDWNELIVDACKRDCRSGQIKDPVFASLAAAGVNPFSVSRTTMPENSNTITSVLTNFLMDGSVTDLQNRWAMLRAFSLDTRPDGYKPLAPGILKHVTAGATAQTNATNYETGNSTVAPVTVTPAEHSVSYQISNTDLNSGVRMHDLVTINTANFANIVIEAATTPMTVANFGAATVIQPAGLFTFTDLATLQAALKKSPIKNLIIDGAYIARISNTPGFFQTAGTVGGDPGAWKAFGWDLIAQNTDWSAAGITANIQGFACNPQAIGGIIGLPILPPNIPGGILSSSVMTVEGLDIQVLAEAWFNPATRTSWNSLRCMDGWAAVDKTAGFTLVSQ